MRMLFATILYIIHFANAETDCASSLGSETPAQPAPSSNSQPTLLTFAPGTSPSASDYKAPAGQSTSLKMSDIVYIAPDPSEDDYQRNISWFDTEYGGSYKCPSGEIYQVAAYQVSGGSCGELAGTGGEEIGLCNMKPGPWSKAKVVCAQERAYNPDATFFRNIDTLFKGYNILMGNPLPFGHGTDPGYTNKIFHWAYDQKRQTADLLYMVPNWVTASNCFISCTLDMTATTIKSESSYKDTLEKAVSWDTSVGGNGAYGAFSFGFNAAFSGSTEFSMMNQGFKSRDAQYVMSTASCCSYTFKHRNGAKHATLNHLFVKDVKSLPLTYEEIPYAQFVETYGTHYVRSVTMGSKYVEIDQITTDTMSKLESGGSSATSAWETQVCANWMGYGASNSIGRSTSHSSSNEHGNAGQFSTLEQHVVTLGAHPPKSASDGRAWTSTVVDNPQPIQANLGFISYLLSPAFESNYLINPAHLATKKKHLEQYLSGYCQSMKDSGSLAKGASCVDESTGYTFPAEKAWITNDNSGQEKEQWNCPKYKNGNKLKAIEVKSHDDYGVVDIVLRCIDGSKYAFTNYAGASKTSSIATIDEYSSIVGLKAMTHNTRGVTNLMGKIESIVGASNWQPAFQTPWITDDKTPQITTMRSCPDGTYMVGMNVRGKVGSGIIDIQIQCWAGGDTQCASSEGEMCYCNGQARMGSKGVSTGWKKVHSQIMCSTENFGTSSANNPGCFCRNVPTTTRGFENPTTNVDQCKQAQADQYCCMKDNVCLAGGDDGTYSCHMNANNCRQCGGQYEIGNPVGCDANNLPMNCEKCPKGICDKNSDGTCKKYNDGYHCTIGKAGTPCGYDHCFEYGGNQMYRVFTETCHKEVDDREFAPNGCKSLTQSQCCHYVESKDDYRGSPCVPAKDHFNNGFHCESALWATAYDASQIGQCEIYTVAQQVDIPDRKIQHDDPDGGYVRMQGFNQKCEKTGNAEHDIASRKECEAEANQKSAKYYSYAESQKVCFYSWTCSNKVSSTTWDWKIYENLSGYTRVQGSNQKCERTGNVEQHVVSRHECEAEAKHNNAKYYSYAESQKLCFYSSTCSNKVSSTGWDWEIYEKGQVKSGATIYILSTNTNKYIDVTYDYGVKARFDDRGIMQALQIFKSGASDGTDINSGDTVYLKSVNTGKFIDVTYDGVQARWDDQTSWQALTIKTDSGTGPVNYGEIVYLWSHRTESDIDVTDHGGVQSQFSDHGAWQRLKLMQPKNVKMCTGDFQERGLRPPAGTPCVSECQIESGRWGSTWCDTEGANWGAECVPCQQQDDFAESELGINRRHPVSTKKSAVVAQIADDKINIATMIFAIIGGCVIVYNAVKLVRKHACEQQWTPIGEENDV